MLRLHIYLIFYKMCIVCLFIICLVLNHIQLSVQAYFPSGYVGCFRDFHKRILKDNVTTFATNGGDICKQYCRSFGYRYAGTEFRYECFCGDQIMTKILNDGCNTTCSGNIVEYCGGSWHISIYDTWETYTTSTSSSPTTKTTLTAKTSETRSSRETETSGTFNVTTAEEIQVTTRIEPTSIFPHLKTTDNSSPPMMAIYGSGPVVVVVVVAILVIIGVIYRRRKLSHKREDESPVIGHGSGSVQQRDLGHNSNTCISAIGNTEKNKGRYIDEADQEIRVTFKQPDEGYSILSLRPVEQDVHDNSYDHISNPTGSVNETYSHLLTVSQTNPHAFAGENDIYSHIENGLRPIHTNNGVQTCSNIYNTIALRSDKTDEMFQQNSTYDQAHTEVPQIKDECDFSRITTVTTVKNKERKVEVENIYYNDDEYAKVSKK